MISTSRVSINQLSELPRRRRSVLILTGDAKGLSVFPFHRFCSSYVVSYLHSLALLAQFVRMWNEGPLRSHLPRMDPFCRLLRGPNVIVQLQYLYKRAQYKYSLNNVSFPQAGRKYLELQPVQENSIHFYYCCCFLSGDYEIFTQT